MIETMVYLDHNATTPMKPAVRDVLFARSEQTGNASSVHRYGREARKVIEQARADVAAVLQTAPYLITILGESLSPYTLPTLVFLLAAATAFASGSSWGVMAILMPLVIPLCWAVLQSNGIADAEHMHILYSCIACVLTGAVWADHCSPISDTTVLSSLATGCDHMDHVRTQIPYALLGGAVAVGVGVLPAGFGLPWFILLPSGAIILVVVHRFLGKRVLAAREP